MKWQKSSYSNPSGNSLEVSENEEGAILIRESADPDAAPTVTDRTKFGLFIQGVKDGEFDHFAS